LSDGGDYNNPRIVFLDNISAVI